MKKNNQAGSWLEDMPDRQAKKISGLPVGLISSDGGGLVALRHGRSLHGRHYRR